MAKRSKIISMNVDIINLAEARNWVFFETKKPHGSYVCVSNVHMCMECHDSLSFREIVNNADLVIPDGRPLSWAQKLMGHHYAEQVRGQDIMNEICAYSGEKSLNIGLYGGSSESLLQKVIENLSRNYPDINITFAFSPPFRELTQEEDKKVISDINNANVDVLFVGIGCPKQERWMAEHKSELRCVMLGVGAAYDFIAGSKKHAPKLLQKLGMEWFYRLISEPSRLWRRYLKQNPRFIFYMSKQLISIFINKAFKDR